MPKNTLYILGTGGHAKEMILLIQEINRSRGLTFNLAGILTDNINTAPNTLEGIQVYREKTILDKITWRPYILIGIGDPTIRKSIVDRLHTKVDFPYFIHPLLLEGVLFDRRHVTALDSFSSKPMSDGVVISKGVNLTTSIQLGKHVHLNTGCTVCHDVEIGDYSIVSPGAIICGNVRIGNNCYIGAGAVIRDGISVADNTTIGAGAVVVNGIYVPGGTYIGVPAKLLTKGGS